MERPMTNLDFDQRIEEIQFALAHLFDSPKNPAVSFLDAGDKLILHLSWVTEAHADSMLDERCAATLQATRAQFVRYAGYDTAQRREIQQRIGERVIARFEESRKAPAANNECSFEVVLDDALFEVGDKMNYRPTL
jgi:hypothetical protein